MSTSSLWNGLNRRASSVALFASALVFAMPLAPAEAGPSSRGVALVYSGRGACEEGCARAAARVAEMSGLRARFISPAEIRAQELDPTATVWIQPGGDAIQVVEALGAQGLERIRAFIRSGHGYVGFCAGAFLADSTVDNPETIPGLGIIPVETADFPIQDGKSPTIVALDWRGSHRSVFFQEGGYFKTTSRSDLQILARYHEGSVAAIRAYYGRGAVVVSGFHPEAPESWRRAAVRKDPDGSDMDIAGQMLEMALPGAK